ncbi:60S ribosomal protein L8B [Apiospora arundinis]
MALHTRHTDDMHRPLPDIARTATARGSTLIRELVEIQRYQVTEEKCTDFVEELECLYVPGRRPEYTSGTQQHLKRRIINAFEEHRYIAVSYTWQASPYESDTHDGNGNTQTPVSMTPTIITDLTSRDLKSNWDRLPIAANCCLHSVRLNSIKLRKQGRSLSLALLAQYLLNGEILENHPEYGLNVETAHFPIASFLKQQCFYGLRSPSASYGLSYNKGCRFVDVRLRQEGIQTKGHLWKVDALIPSDTFLREPRFSRPPSTKVQLKRLANELRSHYQSSPIPRQLRQFVDELNKKKMPFAMQWKLHMAEYVIDSIRNSKTLCTARLLGAQPGCAIFVVECDGDEYGPHPGDRPRSPEIGYTDSETSWSSCCDSDQSSEDTMGGSAPDDLNYIFTSFQPGEELDRHVSMEVDSQDLNGHKNHRQPPRLYAKRWINGLCFFDGSPRQDVIFPWPPAIRNM